MNCRQFTWNPHPIKAYCKRFPRIMGFTQHIRIDCPKKTGPHFWNYKGFFGIVLLATCDARYNLIDWCRSIWIDQWTAKAFARGRFSYPATEKLAGWRLDKGSFFLVDDEIFHLKNLVLRPHAGVKKGNLDESKHVYLVQGVCSIIPLENW